MTFSRTALACVALAAASPSAHAASLTLDSLTTPIATNADIKQTPKEIASGVGMAVTSGLIMTGGKDLGADIGDKFLAWCFDLIHPIGFGRAYEYEVVDAPYSNSYLLNGADLRVSNIINANYDSLEATDAVQAAAFQLAVWEVANDDDFDLRDGVFQASGYGENADEITKTAQWFLSNGETFEGEAKWDAVFLETREEEASQNLVTAVARNEISPVPLPAAGFMLLGGLMGLFALRRR